MYSLGVPVLSAMGTGNSRGIGGSPEDMCLAGPVLQGGEEVIT